MVVDPVKRLVVVRDSICRDSVLKLQEAKLLGGGKFRTIDHTDGEFGNDSVRRRLIRRG